MNERVKLTYLQCRDYTLKKIKSFCDRGGAPLAFLCLYGLIINKLYRVKPPQKGFTFSVAGIYSLIYCLSTSYVCKNMGEAPI